MNSDAVTYWVRAEAYELHLAGRGVYVRPAPGAEFEVYDPWEEIVRFAPRRQGERTRNRSKLPAYAALTNLLEHPELERARGAMVPTLSSEAEGLLLAWCRQFGLLGLAHHQIRRVIFPARFEPDRESGRILYPTLRHCEWAAGDWSEHFEQVTGGATYERTDSDPPGGPRVPTDAYPDGWPSPGVICRPIMGPDMWEWKSAPFGRWTDYFPAIPIATGDWPTPLQSERFWRAYAEPVGEFLNAVHDLHDVLGAAADHRRARRDDAPRAGRFFNRFLDRVHPVLVPAERGWHDGWAAPSLLATLALMARDDLAGQSLHHCASPDCGRLFRSRARAVEFCSSTCRSREQKRKEAQQRRRATTK